MNEEKEFNDLIETPEMSAKKWQKLLHTGWDRVGLEFFRVRFSYPNGAFGPAYERMPLRYRLADFEFSKSQRKIWRQNADLRIVHAPARITPEKVALFKKWYLDRFQRDSELDTWITEFPPVPMREIRVYKGKTLVACSFFDNTPQAQYSVLGFFDPAERQRSLGTFTLLAEIQRAIDLKKDYHYPGHAYMQAFMYEYKKNFKTAEHFDWQTETWTALPATAAEPHFFNFIAALFQ
jgi:leucyl-tRNA---protein transferase